MATTHTVTRGVKNGMPVTEAIEGWALSGSPVDAGPSSRNQWLQATLTGTRQQSRHSRTLVFRVPGWTGHLAGQHVDVRLTAEDGYVAERSYSLAEPTTPDRVAITVDLLPHGEVSSYLVHTMAIGDQLDVRGPLGGWFIWEPGDPSPENDPILLVAGGSGVVPLVTMLRVRHRAQDPVRMMLVYSVRSPKDLLYGPELQKMSTYHHERELSPGAVEIRVVYTRHTGGAPGRGSRISACDLRLPERWSTRLASRVYVCGPSGFADHAAGLLHEAGYSDSTIRIERFGTTGAR